MKAQHWYVMAMMITVVMLVGVSILLYQDQQNEPDTDVSTLSNFCKVHMLPTLAPGAVENCDVWAEAFLEMYPATRERCINLAEFKDIMFMCLDNQVNGRD
jgi:hypothetical protein